jgi:dCTP deaminase
MSVLAGRAIQKLVLAGDITITPFSAEQLNPVSYDVTLGEHFKVYRDSVHLTGSGLPDLNYLTPRQHDKPLFSQGREETFEYIFRYGDSVTLRPGIGYLCHTREAVGSKHYVPVLDGKSSIGRMFVNVHATAGFGDPGFVGQWTLEISVVQIVTLKIGMRIAQVRFMEIADHGLGYDLYQGHYGADAIGAVESRVDQQIKEHFK